MSTEQHTLYLKVAISVITIGILVVAFYFLSSRKKGLLSQNPTTALIRVAWSIFRHWSHLVKGLLSLSLSTSEQSIFEEEFKYLIVTSSLFNETPQQQLPQKLQQQEKIENTHLSENDDEEEQFFTNSNKSLLIRVLGISTFNVIISIIILTKFNFVSPLLIPCIISTYVTTCYFLYRHHRHVQIRRIHACALDSMHKIISLSQQSDAILIRLSNHFHCFSSSAHQKQEFGTKLSTHFETYIEFVHQLQPLIDKQNLSRLRDMYNVKEEIPSLLLEFDSHQYTMDDIDLIYSVIGWKRREYLLYLLALDVMSTNRRNTHYGKHWKQAIHINTSLVKEYNQFNKNLSAITVHSDLLSVKIDNAATRNDTISSPSVLFPSSPKDGSGSSVSISDKRSLALMHRVSAVEKHIEDIQAKLFLCKQDTKLFSSGRVSTISLERMSKRFNHIDENIINLLTQWEESKNALNILLEDEQSKLNEAILLPSPPSSPRGFRQTKRSSYDADSSNSFESFFDPVGRGGLNRSRSCSASSSISISGRPSSFSKNRLQRIQSLKTKNNRIAAEPPKLTPTKTTAASY